MKARFPATWMIRPVPVMIIALASTSLAQSQSNLVSAPTAPAAISPAKPPPAGGSTLSLTRPEFPAPAVSPLFAPSKDSPLPAGVRLSFWTGEMVKLARAGIDESVLLAFVDDAGTFNLGAGDIIYLSDLGVPGPVVSAMLQHDLEFALGNRAPDSFVMSASPPSVHLVFLTNVTSTASVPAVSAPVATPVAEPVTMAVPEFAAFEIPAAPAGLREPAAPPSTAGRAASGKRALYAIREPYPEQVTGPILVFRMPERIPNIQVLEPFP